MSENELPIGWRKVQLSTVCQLCNGFAFNSNDYISTGIPLIRISDIKNGSVILKKTVKVRENSEYDKYSVAKGDILIAMSGATTGKFGIYAESEKAYQNQRVGKFVIKSNDALDNKFLLYQLDRLKRQIEKEAYGGAQPNISSNKIEAMSIVLPPLPEQERIVAKIEELFSELDKGVENLQTIKQQLKVYRQAVLKDAFATAEKFEPLCNLAEMCLGKMLDVSKNKGESHNYLRNINVRWFKFDLSNLLQMRFEEHETERYSIVKGDLIACEGGEPGRCAVWQSDEPLRIQKALHRIRVKESLNATFLMYYLWFISQTGSIDKYFTGTTIKHLTGQSLKKIEIPILRIDEQDKIVIEIETRLSVCDKIEQTVDETLLKAESLRQSILKKAFEGKLV